jgi:hypothetical protein
MNQANEYVPYLETETAIRHKPSIKPEPKDELEHNRNTEDEDDFDPVIEASSTASSTTTDFQMTGCQTYL